MKAVIEEDTERVKECFVHNFLFFFFSLIFIRVIDLR